MENHWLTWATTRHDKLAVIEPTCPASKMVSMHSKHPILLLLPFEPYLNQQIYAINDNC